MPSAAAAGFYAYIIPFTLPIIQGHYTRGMNQKTLAHNSGQYMCMKVAMFVKYINVKDLTAS